jgi:radical SAM protein with 4Fe4S-binding SPASM domain
MLDATASHFRSPVARQECANLFAESVTNVVLEISRHCNRQCEYCPVSDSDRRFSGEILPLETFESILRDLETIQYSRSICLNLYNEPTADRALLLDRIRLCREVLPNSRIYFSSNGDYLTDDYIHDMVTAGLSELYVTLHLPKGEKYTDEGAVTRFTEFAARLGRPIRIHAVATQRTIQGSLILHGLPITVFSTNYMAYGSDRAGSVASVSNASFKRTSPCSRPFQDFTVSYDGTIFPCCQMFVDNAEHLSRYSIGNISDFETIFHAFSSPLMAHWRSELLRESPKSAPCESCTEGCYQVPKDERDQRDSLYESYVGPISPAPSLGDAPRVRDRFRSLFNSILS